MATRYRFGENYYAHFITYSVVNWIDALSRPVYKDIVVDSLKHCIDKKGLKLHAWVIMNNHVHLIITAEDDNKLADIIRDHKKFTAQLLLQTIADNQQESRKSWMMWLFSSAGKENPNNKNYQFWQQDNHPIILSTPEMMVQRLNYLHQNPVRAGIVYKAEDFVYSSAIDYYTDNKGLLPIELSH